MVRLGAEGSLETDPSKDNTEEWDHKDHLAFDICAGERLAKATVTHVVEITPHASDLSKEWRK
jgi:hypothetical protein